MVGTGVKFTNPDGSTETEYTTAGYVDNPTNFINDLLCTTFGNEFELSSHLQQQTQAWEELLSTSGGKLELPKNFAYIVAYFFVDGEPTQRTNSQLESSIAITDSTTGL
jgi:hypothetical protein